MTTSTTQTVREVVIHVAALIGEQSSDKKPSVATAFTTEVDDELVDSGFHILDRIHHTSRALLFSLRNAIDPIPAGTKRVTIICGFERLVRLGSNGELPVDHRRFWREVRECLSPYETIWKLANETDERQQALLRCLRSLLQDPSLAGPRLVTQPRRRRRAVTKQPLPNALSADDAICAHSNVIDSVKASAA